MYYGVPVRGTAGHRHACRHGSASKRSTADYVGDRVHLEFLKMTMPGVMQSYVTSAIPQTQRATWFKQP